MRGLAVVLVAACGSSTRPTTPTPTPAHGVGSALVAAPITPSSTSTPAAGEVGARLAVDDKFGSAGHVDVQIADREHQLHDVIVLPDGKLLAAGHAPFGTVPALQLAAFRFTESGALDRTFGGGVGVAQVGWHGAFGRTLTVDPKGRILVGGYFFSKQRTEHENVLIGRLLPDGTADPTFANQGVIAMDLTKSDDRPVAIFVQPSGHILVVGIHSNQDGYDTFLARFDDGGWPDPSFGTQGVTYFDPLPGREFTTRAVLDPADGSIVIAGYTVGTDAAFVARIDARGKPVTAFGKQGVTVIDSVKVSTAWAAAIDPASGKILVGGQLGNDRGFIARFTRDGAFDPKWGKQGIALGPRASDQYYSLLPSTGGATAAVGFRGLASDSRPLVARFLATGRLDPAFGSNGVLLGPRDGDFLFGAAADGEGRLVGVGMSAPDRIILGLVMRFASR